MAQQIFPTKGNLIAIKKQYKLAKLGYELLDRKRNIMLREMLQMADNASRLQKKSEEAFKEAYLALQHANVTSGQSVLWDVASLISEADDINIRYRSVMGIEVPEAVVSDFKPELAYGLCETDSYVDQAYIKFNKAKNIAALQAASENAVYRLAFAIKQAQKRANALKNIVLPRFEKQIAYITSFLEEKEREEFSTMKIVKANEA